MDSLTQKTLRRSIAYLLLLLLPPTISAANTSIVEPPQEKLPVTFANSRIKPWGMLVDGSPQGLLIDIQHALSLETQYEHQVFLQPYSRTIHSIYSGEVDMAILFDAKVDLSHATKVASIVESRAIIVGRAGISPLNTTEALQGQLVGHMRGSKYGPAFDETTHFKKVPINTMHQGLAMLSRGRIDAMTGIDLTFYWAIKQMQLSPQDFSPLITVSKTTTSLYISKKSPKAHLIPIYRNAMKVLQEKGIIEEIFSHSTDWNKMDGWSKPWQPKANRLQSSSELASPHHRQ
ncbi:MAG: substrate-binding periplasmic protein [Cellvibrionaceae bacterium]